MTAGDKQWHRHRAVYASLPDPDAGFLIGAENRRLNQQIFKTDYENKPRIATQNFKKVVKLKVFKTLLEVCRVTVNGGSCLFVTTIQLQRRSFKVPFNRYSSTPYRSSSLTPWTALLSEADDAGAV